MIAGLPTVSRLLRGDERIGWEIRMAHDLAVDRSQYEPAARLFERCSRAVEAGGLALAWSIAAARTAPAAANLDVHWIAALSNPTGVAAPWLSIAAGLFTAGKAKEGFVAACRGMTSATAKERPAAISDLVASWRLAGLSTPIDGDQAYDAGLLLLATNLEQAVQHLRWAAACEPGNPNRALSLATALVRAGLPLEAIRVLAAHERSEAPRTVGKMLYAAQRYAEAVPILRYASRRFKTADDFVVLANAAAAAENDSVAVEAAQRALKLGAQSPELLTTLAIGLYRLGAFVECEKVAQQLITAKGASKEARTAGLHAMARALAGQGRHVDAHPYAKDAMKLAPAGDLARELMETMDTIVAQGAPPVRVSPEVSMERQAFKDLEAGNFEQLVSAITSPSWTIARAALAANEFRTDDENGIPVAPRALEAALDVLARSAGSQSVDAVLARIRALRIRDNAFIQIDPPPPLGVRYTAAEFEKAFAERDRRPHRPSAIQSFSR